jgi:hypothetical protein
MNGRSRVTAWLGAAQGIGGAWYVVEIGRTSARGEWDSVTIECECDGDESAAARAGLLAALSTLAEPSRVGVAVTDKRVAKALRALVKQSAATRPHEVSITCISSAADYAAAAVECNARARELAAGTKGGSGG